MPIDQEKLRHLEEKFQLFDPANTKKLAKADFYEFINSFTISGKPEETSEEEEESSISLVKSMVLVGAENYDQKTCNFLWKSLDIKEEGYISQRMCFYCLRGLAGHFTDFTMKVFFRVLDVNHNGTVSNNELRKMRKWMGLIQTEDEMIKKFEKKLGKRIDKIDWSFNAMGTQFD